MIIIRLILFACACYVVNYLGEIGLHGKSSSSAVVAYVLLKTGFCLIAYFYGKWFVFVYRKTQGETGFIVFFDLFLLPLISINILNMLALMKGAFNPLMLLLWLFAVLVTFDRNGSIGNYLWNYRQYDFKNVSYDGVVTKRELDVMFTRTIILLIALPVAGLIFL